MLMHELDELRSIIELEPHSGAQRFQGARSESDAWQHVLSLGVTPTIASLKQRALCFRTEVRLRASARAHSPRCMR